MKAYGNCNPGGPAHAHGVPVPTLVRPTGRDVITDLETAHVLPWRIPVTEPARRETWAPVRAAQRARRRAEIDFKVQATANECVRLYVEDELTIPQVAERLRSSRRTVRRHLLDQGVQLRNDRIGRTGGQNRRTDDAAFVAQAVKSYQGGLSVQAVAYALGTGPRQVRAALALAGVDVIPPRSRRAGINGDPPRQPADRERCHHRADPHLGAPARSRRTAVRAATEPPGGRLPRTGAGIVSEQKPNRAPGVAWVLRRDLRDYVRTLDDDRVLILAGEDRAILNLDRNTARLLAKRINECLDQTTKL